MKKKVLFVLMFIAFFCVIFLYGIVMHPYQSSYTITSVNFRKVVVNDSLLKHSNLYLMECNEETSDVDYDVFKKGLEPYMCGCSDSLYKIRILCADGMDVLDSFKKIDSNDVSKCWELDNGNHPTLNCYSVEPKDILSFYEGHYRFEDGEGIPHGCNPLLLCLDNDSVVPEIIELHCKDRIIRGKVNNVPQELKLVNVLN